MMFVPAGPLTPAFPEGVAGAGVGGPRRAAGLEYGPLSLGLLISSGFQASGGGSGHPFQGAVAPAAGRGSRKWPAEPGGPRCYWGLAWSWRGSAGLRANARATAPPRPRRRLGSLGRRGSPFRFSAAGEIPLRLEGPAQCGRPRGSAPRQDGPLGDFSCGQCKGQVGRRRWLVQGAETLQGS